MHSLKRLNDDDINYIELLYKENYDYLYNIAKIIEYDEEIVNESIQDTFLTAASKLAVLKIHTNKRKWLVNTLRNKIKENKRKYKYVKHIGNMTIHTLSDDLILKIAENIGISDTYFYETSYVELRDKFNEALSDTELKYLQYKYIEDYSNAELSKKLGISYTNVSTMGLRIRIKIKRFMQSK